MHLGDPWTSFPSAHTTLAMALATGIALEARRPWATALVFGVASTVALQRVYTQVYTRAHWASDVVGSTVLAIGASATTVEWLARGGLRGCCRADESRDGPVRLGFGPGTVAIDISF